MAEVCCFPFSLCLPTELWTIVDTPGGESSSPWFRQDLNPERCHLSWSTHHNKSSLQDFLRHDSNKISPGGRADPPRLSPICWRGLWHPSPPGRHRWPLSGPGRAKLQTTRQLRRLKCYTDKDLGSSGKPNASVPASVTVKIYWQHFSTG